MAEGRGRKGLETPTWIEESGTSPQQKYPALLLLAGSSRRTWIHYICLSPSAKRSGLVELLFVQEPL